MGYFARLGMGTVACALMVAGMLACSHQVGTSDDSLNQPLRVLLVSDPFAHALQRIEPQLRDQLDMRLEVVDYNSLHTILMRDSDLVQSDFDLISIDVLWLKELVEAGALLNLESHLSDIIDNPDDFLGLAWQQCQYEGQQWAIPIQPHAELLWLRDDLLATIETDPPRTTTDLLRVAAALHAPEEGRYGIVWNAQRGHPLGQSMAHFYAAHGADILDADGRPALDSPEGIAAATFARDLLAYSPPDILQIAWDERVARFALGQAAITYGWGARSTILAPDGANPLAEHVSYHPAPHAPGSTPVSPLGTWALAIPANLGERQERALQALQLLSTASTHRLLVESGMAASPRRSLLKDPTLQGQHPIFSVMQDLEASKALGSHMRPAISQGPQLSRILGTVFHDMLQGHLSPEEAVRTAQRQALAIWDSSHSTDEP
ncbi:MAG: extracellular solute-binding protein [Planctomycetota bacterium]|nr:MAG: extracellular solute-binding protein [Planctomycetota bacterium]